MKDDGNNVDCFMIFLVKGVVVWTNCDFMDIFCINLLSEILKFFFKKNLNSLYPKIILIEN